MYQSRISRLLTILMVSFVGRAGLYAQESGSSADQAFTQQIEDKNSIAKFTASLSPTTAKTGQEVTLSIHAVIEKGWHIGATTTEADSIGFPTQIKFETVGLEAVDTEFTSSVKPHRQSLDVGTQLLMDGEFSWTRKYRVISENAKYSGTGSIRFQACDDRKCLPPKTVKFELGTKLPPESTSASDKTMTPTSNDQEGSTEKKIGSSMVISLESCDLTRTKPQMGNLVSLLLSGRQSEKMVWKATLTSGPDQGVSIYLPKAKRYSMRNTGSDGTIVSNTAAYISVDQNGDGVLADWEAAPLDRPVRIRDSMYRVSEINVKNKSLTLHQLDMPLKGSLVGFRCPDFEYTALDGSVISNKSILGKTTILDIWAVSCHNCYEGFPKIQNAIDKHSSEKLQVILMTVDTDRKYYDSQAPRLFETYGGGNWPQVMLPGGFNGALTIGDYGFGSVIVDPTGIVRAVGVLSFNIEATIDEVIKNAAQNGPSVDDVAKQTPAMNLRLPMDRENSLDCFPGLSERLDAMRAESKLLSKQMIQEGIKNPTGLDSKPVLPTPLTEVLSASEIASKLKRSKLYVGWFFKCNHCDNWHLNLGAGFPVAEGGLIATCHHVIAPSDAEMKEGYLVVLDCDGNALKVESVVAADPVSDCALLKIANSEGLPPLALNLAPKVGGESYVLSNPMGISDYFSHGLINRIFVNSPSRDLSESETKRHMRLNVGADWAPGSSGAPVVDHYGNLIGFVAAARQLMGPAGQAVQADGTLQPGPTNGITTFLTAHEAGTATAVQMLIESSVK